LHERLGDAVTTIAPSLRNRQYMQLCWVVPDLERAIDHWVRSAGAGPFFVFGAVQFDGPRYRGIAEQVEACRASIGQFGDTQIELVEPAGDGTGLWSDFSVNGKTTLHHAGLYCTDYETERAAYTDSGSPVVFEGLMMGARTCYIDTTATLGFLTELITANPVAEQVFGAVRSAAKGWDGTDPVRSMG
jgi:hypothetical protein